MTEDSTLVCSASDTVCRAIASLAAICFFFRLFRLWDGDHSCLCTYTGVVAVIVADTKTFADKTRNNYTVKSRQKEKQVICMYSRYTQ